MFRDSPPLPPTATAGARRADRQSARGGSIAVRVVLMLLVLLRQLLLSRLLLLLQLLLMLRPPTDAAEI